MSDFELPRCANKIKIEPICDLKRRIEEDFFHNGKEDDVCFSLVYICGVSGSLRFEKRNHYRSVPKSQNTWPQTVEIEIKNARKSGGVLIGFTFENPYDLLETLPSRYPKSPTQKINYLEKELKKLKKRLADIEGSQ